MSKDNTCPTCLGRGGWEFEPGEISPCGTCHGSGQQDIYANNPPKTYEEKQQDKLKPYKPGQQEDKPTPLEIVMQHDCTDSRVRCNIYCYHPITMSGYHRENWVPSTSSYSGKCGWCTLSFTDFEDFWRHMGAVHTDSKPTIDCDCVAHQMGCDAPLTGSKPDNHKNTPEIVNDENELHKKTQENVNKPEKPQYWACVDHAIGSDESTADGRCAGCRELHVPADYRPDEPSQPDQLRGLSAITANLYLAGKWQSNQQEALKEAISGIEALIYQSYDMGFSDGFTARNKSLYRKSEAE